MMKRILIVDDTPSMLEMFQILLEAEGYEVLLSSFPYKQISDVEDIRPDLIILDYVFEGKKIGWQMVQLLKMHPSTASIPIIVCTAAGSSIHEHEADLKDTPVLQKPFKIAELFEMIDHHLKVSND
jgi:CheY-like chemotaxis protein